MLHFTWLLYSLHNYAERLKNYCSKTDNLIVTTIKNAGKRNLFQTMESRLYHTHKVEILAIRG